MKRNRFTRALNHLNKKHVVESAPTNSTLGVFSVTPSGVGPVGWTDRTFTTDISGNPLPKAQTADFTVGENPANATEAQDTSGLFENDGVTVKTLTPPGDNSYILGPFASMWYAWGNFTTFGYIRQADRKMVNLGTITGKLSDWDGASGFSSYGQLTLEQVLWFRDVKKFGDIDNDPANHNYRAFYPGPPSNTPDEFGRYRCVIADSKEEGGEETRPGAPDNPTEPGEMSSEDNFALIMNKIRAGDKLSPEEKEFLRSRLPNPGSIKGNRMMKEALVMPPDLFTQKYGLDPEEVTEFYREVHGTEVTATPPPPASTRGLDSRAIELGYNDPNYPVNPDGYYNQQLSNAEEILQSLLDAEFYGSLARGDSPNYSNAEISKAKADLEKAKKERENWEKWKDDNDYKWRGDIQTTADKPESLDQEKQEVEEVRKSLETGEGINWDTVFKYIDAGLLAWDAASMAGVMFPELGSSIVGGLGLGVGRILRGARNILKGATGARKVLKGPKTATPKIPPKPKKKLPKDMEYYWNKNDGEWRARDIPSTPNPTPPKPKKKLPKDMEYNWNPKGGSDGKGQWEVRGTDNFWNTGGGGGPKPPKGGGDGPTPKFTDPTTGRPLDSVDPSSIRRPDGKPFDQLPPKKLGISEPLGSPTSNKRPGVKRPFDLPGDFKPSKPANVTKGKGKTPKPNDADTQYSPNIFTRGRTKRNDSWVDRGSSAEKTAKSISDLVRDNLTGVDAQRISSDPNAAWNPARGMPGYGTAKGKLNPRIRNINQARVKRGKPELTPDQINPGGFQTGPDEASRRLIKGIGKLAGNVGKSNVSKNVSKRLGKKRGSAFKESFLLEEIQSTDDAQQYMVDRLLKFIKDPKFVKNLDKIISKLDSYEKKSKKKNIKESTFSKKNLLREIVIPEEKKKYKVKPKVIGHPSNKTLSNQMKDTTPNVAFKKEIPVWSMDQKIRNARSSQEKKNEVLEYLGSSGDHWEYMTKTIKEHNKKIINLNYGGNKKKVTRKEQVDKDTLVFMEDDLGNKSSVLQSKINEMQADVGDKEMFAKYYEMNPVKKKSLFKEVVKRGVFDYKGKPSKKGYPDKEPEQLDPNTGMHPKYGKKYKYDKLDPHSAESMPMQGNPEIDANIEKNADQEKKKRKSNILNQPNS